MLRRLKEARRFADKVTDRLRTLGQMVQDRRLTEADATVARIDTQFITPIVTFFGSQLVVAPRRNYRDVYASTAAVLGFLRGTEQEPINSGIFFNVGPFFSVSPLRIPVPPNTPLYFRSFVGSGFFYSWSVEYPTRSDWSRSS